MGALFGCLTALSIGLGDLFARRVVRASTAFTAAVAVSVVAIPTSVLAVVLFGGTFAVGDVAIGLASGLGAGAGLAGYYGGLSRSSAAVVTPAVATISAIIPFAYALARGADAALVSVIGAAVAIGGIVVITVGGGGVRRLGSGLLWGCGSGVAYGVGFAIIIDASADAGAWPAVGQRVAASALTAWLVIGRSERLIPPAGVRSLALIAGVFAGSSTVCYLVGVRADPTATVITASMFPAVTVAIGRIVFGDAVSRMQAVGVAIVLVGIVGVVAA